MFRLDDQPHTIEELDSILDEAMKEGVQTNNQGVSFWKIVFAFDIETESGEAATWNNFVESLNR